jgi:hypothetical protein
VEVESRELLSCPRLGHACVHVGWRTLATHGTAGTTSTWVVLRRVPSQTLKAWCRTVVGSPCHGYCLLHHLHPHHLQHCHHPLRTQRMGCGRLPHPMSRGRRYGAASVQGVLLTMVPWEAHPTCTSQCHVCTAQRQGVAVPRESCDATIVSSSTSAAHCSCVDHAHTLTLSLALLQAREHCIQHTHKHYEHSPDLLPSRRLLLLHLLQRSGCGVLLLQLVWPPRPARPRP